MEGDLPRQQNDTDDFQFGFFGNFGILAILNLVMRSNG
jgi:hypothetical protein